MNGEVNIQGLLKEHLRSTLIMTRKQVIPESYDECLLLITICSLFGQDLSDGAAVSRSYNLDVIAAWLGKFSSEVRCYYLNYSQ